MTLRLLTPLVPLLAITVSGLLATDAPASSTAALEPSEAEIGEPVSIELWPARVDLSLRRATRQLVVRATYAGGRVRDLTRVAELTAEDESLVAVEGGVVRPLASGETAIVARVGGREARIPVRCELPPHDPPTSFRYETLPALAKPGCSSGPCHGSPSGKGGFRLSLRAFDPELDRFTLLRESWGRRVDAQAPDASLLLLKPLGAVAHGGGVRLRAGDPAHAVLRRWISDGCPTDTGGEPSLVGLHVGPSTKIELERPAWSWQLAVEARFSDGSTRDVTELAVYTSSHEQVATVSDGGLVEGSRRGETAVLVRYLDRLETVLLTFVEEVEGFVWPDPRSSGPIDDIVQAKLRKLRFPPSALASDEEIVRRLHLDVIGRLPTSEETLAFLADESADKRERLIDSLLERPEYATFWASKWADILRLTDKSVSRDGARKYWDWLVRSFARNEPYDRFARELLTASGSTYENPAANYWRTTNGAEDAAESSAQVFLGFRLACAKCHNHPFERWTQDDYFGLTAFFQRVQRKPGPRRDELVVWVERRGETRHLATGRTAAPALPLAGAPEIAPETDRREVFTSWLVSAENPFFARVEVNRIWYHLFGKGIVDPVDDFRDSNPPAHAELLELLAREFRDSGFDRKRIIRTILRSRTYQTSAETNALNVDDDRYFSHATPRLLTAEQLLDAIVQVTGVEQRFDGTPPGTTATALPVPDARLDFLKVFGQPERQTVCQCERATETNLSKALQMFNGSLIHDKLRHGGNRLRRLTAAGKSDDEVVEELWIAALSRRPSVEELATLRRYIAAKDDRLTALEDVCWALLNGKEFLFQH